jgi:lipopolysaccharide/colanic/teichoic acid biosynthesis glycosyltransferase
MITTISPLETGLNLMHDHHGLDACDDPIANQQPELMPVVDVEVPKFFALNALWGRPLGAILLVLFSPLILLLILAVRLTSPGPALFRQKRVGRNGQEFKILKIRTMYRDAEAVSGPKLCQPGDSRMTPVGRLLRVLHLDELPQLVNVMRGEMSIVGPRPERPEIIARNNLLEKVPGFAQRTKVLPGVTGLAQINLPPDVDAESVIPKVQLDLEYIRTASVGLELRILACTALRMLGVRHGYAVNFFRLGRPTRVSRNTQDAATHRSMENGSWGKSWHKGPRDERALEGNFASLPVVDHHPAFAFSPAAQALDAQLEESEEAVELRLDIEPLRHKPR